MFVHMPNIQKGYDSSLPKREVVGFFAVSHTGAITII